MGGILPGRRNGLLKRRAVLWTIAAQSHVELQAHPPFERDHAPDPLDQPEGPGALQEAVGRAQPAAEGETQHPPGRPRLEGVADQHGGDGEQAEQGKGVQDWLRWLIRVSVRKRGYYPTCAFTTIGRLCR